MHRSIFRCFLLGLLLLTLTHVGCVPKQVRSGRVDPCRGVSCNGSKEQYTCKWGRCVPVWVAKDAGAYSNDTKRFYAVGLISNVDNDSIGRIASKRRCQVELAAVLKTWVENLHKQYLNAVASGKKTSSEQNITDTAKTIVARNIQGTRIMDYYSNEFKGKYATLCSFDMQAAMNMFQQAKKLSKAEKEYVKANSKVAFKAHKDAIEQYLKKKMGN